MAQPVFYTPDKFKYEYASMYDIHELKYYSDRIEGSFGVIVGTYGSHTLYVRGVWDLVMEDDESLELHIDPFPEDGEFIFDLETLKWSGKTDECGDPDKATEILNGMWEKYENICDKAWIEFREYFDSHKKELTHELLKVFAETEPENYRKFMQIYKPE